MAQIDVVVKDETGHESTTAIGNNANTPQKAANNVDPKNQSAKNNKANSKALAAASMIGSQAFRYVTSNIGKWTGNSRNQTAVNNAMQVVSLGAMTYVNVYAALAVAAIQVGTTVADNYYEQKWQERKANARRLRAGYNIDGSISGGRK